MAFRSSTSTASLQPVGRTVRNSGSECSSFQLGGSNPMTYSYTQISQYLSYPRRYRHRYLDGWQEKDTRAAMLFGRAFEQAIAALFRRDDPAAVLFEHWGLCKDMGLTYSGNDTWDRMLQQASSCSSASLRTAAFTFGALVQPSRFSSIGQ